jgi:5-methyltetrahydrofolate--homocysteine methyltransferase
MLFPLVAKNEKYIQSVKEDYEQVRQFQGQRKPKEYLKLEEARANKPAINWEVKSNLQTK